MVTSAVTAIACHGTDCDECGARSPGGKPGSLNIGSDAAANDISNSVVSR